MDQTSGSLKYYIVGAVVIVVLVILAGAFVWHGSATPAMLAIQNPQSPHPRAVANTPATPAADTSAASSVQAPVSPSPETMASPFFGTWTSATAGKGIEASGKVVTSRSMTQVTLTGDVTVVVQKVENDIAFGTISYSKVCSKTVVTATGKAPVTQSPNCNDAWTESFQAKISGDMFTYEGPTQKGGVHTIKGKVSGDTFSGTFDRSSSLGTLKGTFSLVRSAR